MWHMQLPTDVNYIITTLEAAGYQAFAVGGCVRDIIRSVSPKDWDIATSATPAQAKALFLRTIDTGIKHGTITVLLDSQHYEVTTYRIDGEYLDNRRPQTVTFTANITDDLSRRDFTMNAIAYNPHSGFVDPFNGQEDIKNGVIRCVGDALHRFSEDALRMLRAIRFCGVTGYRIDSEILAAIPRLKHNMASISPERIREELAKLVVSQNVQAIRPLEETGLLLYILQGREYGGDLAQVILWLQNCPSQETMRMAIFLYWAGDSCADILRDLRFCNKSNKEISMYVKWLHTRIPYNRYEIKKAMRSIPQDPFENLLTLKAIINPMQVRELENILQEAHDIIDKNECFTLRNLAVNGNDLAAVGITNGTEIGQKLEQLLDMVVREPSLNTKEALLRKLRHSGLDPESNRF